MKYSVIAFVLFVVMMPFELSAQCSDAGACAIGDAYDADDPDRTMHRISAGYVYGVSGEPDDLTFHSLLLEANVHLFGDSRIALRMPWTSIDGPLGSTSGIGDLILLWDQGIWHGNGSLLRVQAGGKIATGEVNAGELPQAYQPGLGTNDILFGVTFDTGPWSFSAGYQYSNGRSDNSVDRLWRGDDLLARAGYRGTIDPVDLGLEVIAIKRLSESSVLDPASESGDQFIDVPDSDQLQVNVLGNASVPLSDALRMFIYAAIPLLQRDVNIDGLKRMVSISAGVEFSF